MGRTLSSANSAAVLPWDEQARLTALDSYGILDTPREEDFDDIAALVAAALDAPIAVVNLIGEGRQWFKAEVGIGVRDMPLDVSICAHALLQGGTMVVADTSLDARFARNPLVAIHGGLRFYAGALLMTPEGLPLGTICVLDRVARPQGISDLQRMTLEVLARQVMTQLELRRLLARKRLDEKELRESETRGRLALDAAELGAWEAVPGSQQIYGDARARELLGYRGEDKAISFDAFLHRVHIEDRTHLVQAVQAAIPSGRLDVEFRVTPTVPEHVQWLRSHAQVFKLPGERHRLIGTIRDISDDKAVETHRQLLTDELAHRVKNTLGVVQGIVHQSLRTVAKPLEAQEAITSRLSTLAHAHDILTQTSWTAAPIHAVVEGAVLAHCTETSRVKITGPTVKLKARAALALSMAFHELFTNAVKYGSLSNETGVVDLTWTVVENLNGDFRFDLVWQEAAGPLVQSPTRTGFGSRLIGSGLVGDLGSKGVIDYLPSGVRWTLSTALAAIVYT